MGFSIFGELMVDRLANVSGSVADDYSPFQSTPPREGE
jgi:hypothetical protein